MAYWHDFNPWATYLIYLPSLEEAAACCAGGTIRDLRDDTVRPYDVDYLVQRWLEQSALHGTPGKLDAYLLRDGPKSIGHRSMHLGVRWGKEPEEYFSPMVKDEALALKLFLKYGGPSE